MDRGSHLPAQRVRACCSLGCFGLYAVLALSFWGAGAIAFWRFGSGAERLLGLLYLPSLALPVVGRGHLLGVAIGGSIWWWWFATQAAVAAIAIWLYPYDRSPRSPSSPLLDRPRLPVSVS